MRRVSAWALLVAILGGVLMGCNAGTADGGKHPADEHFGPNAKPPGVAGAGAPATGAPAAGAPSSAAGAQ